MATPVEISKQLSQSVFDDGLAAIDDSTHPCHHMIEWQYREGVKSYQLPEPFSGRRSQCRLIFVGLNPSFSANEDIPTIEWAFESYDAHYRARFDATNRNNRGKAVVQFLDGNKPKAPRLWSNIELFATKRGISSDFKLGEHAILIEIIHYKSKQGWFGTPEQKETILRHQSYFTGKLLDELAPCVLVAMGNSAIGQLIPLLKLPLEPRPHVRKLMGQTFATQSRSGEKVLVVPAQHFSYLPKSEIQDDVARKIIGCLQEIEKLS